MFFLPRLTLLPALFACAGLHAAPLAFTPCTDAVLPGSLCALQTVPLSHGKPDGAAGELQLFVRKIPSQGKPKGSVWLVAGGPGESGASFYGLLPTLRRSVWRRNTAARPDKSPNTAAIASTTLGLGQEGFSGTTA